MKPLKVNTKKLLPAVDKANANNVNRFEVCTNGSGDRIVFYDDYKEISRCPIISYTEPMDVWFDENVSFAFLNLEKVIKTLGDRDIKLYVSETCLKIKTTL